MRKLLLKTIVFFIIVAFSSPLAFAQEKFPTEPIRLIISHAPGGGTDMPARVIQPYLQKAIGVPVVIENMVGAGGNIARAFVYKQKPDGFNLLVTQQPSMSSGEIVTGAKFETLKLVHVFNISGRNYDCVAVPFDSPFKTIEDMKKASQSQPLTSAGTGIGTNAYIVAMLLQKVGVNLTYVPFNSGVEAALAVAGGKTQMGSGALDSYYPLHEAKKLRILAGTGPVRDESHKEIPNMTELGYPQVKLDQMTGVFAPPGLPKDRLDILVKAFEKAAADPEFKAAAAKAKLTLQPLSGDEFFKASKAMYDTVKGMEDLLKAVPGK
ncbi:MAG: tripartite tricarboxylate transporter substrate binding protein [Thermodesulfobacteriota bacterium]|nr:tripartite tricarboxylate transporter substrate binding protein [Thermodesulfobacteriota bacterium]